MVDAASKSTLILKIFEFLFSNVHSLDQHGPGHIRQRPSNGNCPPDRFHAKGGSKGVSQRHSGPERDHGQQQRNLRLLHSPEISVQQEQNTNAAVARSLNLKISRPNADHLRLFRRDKDSHELARKQEYHCGRCQAEHQHNDHRAFRPLPDPVLFPSPIIL